MKLVHQFTDGDHTVELYQHGNSDFAVEYGHDKSDRLSYDEAVKRYGQCVFHSLSCAGKCDIDPNL